LIRNAREVNDIKPEWVINKVKLAVADHLQRHPDKTAKEITIACFGLAFKPDIDDLRESPALAITRQIAVSHPGPVWVIEPNIAALPIGLTTSVTLKPMTDALETSDIQVLLVDHKEFKATRPSGLANPTLIDTRGIWPCKI
jgi:UDP-N-acetyl-D-mannosaminuronic acid dehydrogenase